ncbi:hypothetical protein MiTe_04251 [Microcystis aeruginosa NIES-2520]|uniref:DUF1822 domain-containing protein n=1 Tax=Microcystis aeruginosa NIES-2520 TaxID=2303982 RepID=A0A5A5RWB2_MICAE|nr:DUF1822 family protein [Microcystis aeruginosa]GCA77397.1 hypothetical protein MiTe_04251 [Microcystis aeruginosa NIES-2520]
MFSLRAIPPDLNLSRPEAIRLEPEQFEQALVNPLASPSVDEAGQWQLYLNALALLGFEQWLEKRAPSHFIDRTQCINHIGAVYNLKIDEFKLNLIVKEQVLDEVVEIPREAIEQPALVAHFYVLLEVCEEQQRLMIRGFLRSDRLMNYCHRVSDSLQNGYYQIPLSVFDPEPNHLLFYCDFLEPASILLPVISTEHTATPEAISETTLTASQETPIQLGQWVQGVFAAGWQAIDDLFSPEVHLAWSPRNQREGAKRGKLIDLGMELQGQRVVLLVNVTEEADNQLSVLVQLHPAGEERYLPPQIKLTLLSQAGKKLQEVGSRTQDNYIQLKSFKGRSGIPFSIVVSLGDTCLCENFEL